MQDLYKILFNLKKIRSKQLFRLKSTGLNVNSPKLSLRRKTWLVNQNTYANCEHILYSSYLELRGLKPFQNKQQLWKRHNEKEAGHSYTYKAPKDWMNDFEYYSEPHTVQNDFSEESHILGTADPTIPTSNIQCNGCGAILHCNHPKSPGFLPKEIFNGRTENELKSITCQRCHFLKNYNLALELEVTPEYYIRTISCIRDKFALAVVLVDLTDFPSSIWPGMNKLLGSKRPVFIVGNKVDLLPRDCNSYLDNVKDCLKKEIAKCGFNRLNVKHVSLISAKTGYGIEELITQLQKIWAYQGDVYLLGCANVGKSSLFNALLNSDYSRPETELLIRKATTCAWPGTTLQMLKFPIYRPSAIRVYQRFERLNSEKFVNAEKQKLRMENARKMGNVTDAVPMGTIRRTLHRCIDDVDDVFAMSKGMQPITTFNENSEKYKNARWVYDTPGVMSPEQITNLFTPQELAELEPKQMISPRSYRLKPGMTLFVAGLARLDFIKSDSSNLNWLQIFLFASLNLPTMIVETHNALNIYDKYLNTPLMKLPMGSEERMRKWPGLQRYPKDLIVKGYVANPKYKERNCSGDITLSSAGWVGVRIPTEVNCVFRAWTPYARGIYLRTQSIVPYAERLIGKLIRNSLAYNTSKPFVFKK